ncbi:MmgE/PrpD family protein [Thermodesulfobacteriota bacterium]
MRVTDQLCNFITNCFYDDLPIDVIEKAKSFLLDYFGAALYGSTKDWSDILANFIKGADCRKENTVIGKNWKTSTQFASLINGTNGHLFELDDFHGKAFLHPGVVVIPSALAAGEKAHVNGKELITSIILGYETMIRIGLAMGLSHSLRGFHPTGTVGPFGAAAAFAKIMGFGREKLLNAFGIVGSLASGIREFYLEGGMIKSLHAGKASENGVVAALLAEKGFTGPRTVLEGNFGFCRAFSDNADLKKIEDNLLEKWEIRDVSLKTYACCGNIHPVVNGLTKLIEENELNPFDINEIVVRTNEKVARQNSGLGTESVMATQYSIPFVTAVTLLEDIEDPNVFNNDLLKDNNILNLAKRVRVEGVLKDAGSERCEVIIKIKGADEFFVLIEKPKGHPEHPLSHVEVTRKFKKLVSTVMTENKALEIINTIKSIEEVNDINILCDLVRK